MKKTLVLLAAILIFSGCLGQGNVNSVVKAGDNVSIDYIGKTTDGKVFDTSIESVAKENNLSMPNRVYQPLNITLGKRQLITGLEEGIVGMKVGETKEITVSPEKGYGPVDPKKISTVPLEMTLPVSQDFPRTMEMPVDQFKGTFIVDPKAGENLKVPNSNVNITVNSVGTNVSVTYNLKTGDSIYEKGAPWNLSVISADNNTIKVKADVKKNEVVTLPNALWNSTIIDVNDTNITLRHIPIPDKDISTSFGNIKVHFNDTAIIIDQNNKYAGKTLIFDVTLKSIG
jgi:FKBP-type peptidyl-prolyl cis-trans isomerase 2